jgi:CelD/BcsL family acetyltransferase involved in cellulose biosynthesis
LDIREFRSPDEMETFLDEAIPLSRKTYQARLLDAGLPEGEIALNQMLALARADCVRAYLLFVDNKPVSYLYLPIEDGIISYAFLGYDPQIANLSPGTVLQLDALERLFAENRYRYFDFTEGEGAHKAMFGTDSVAACSFFLLKGSVTNRTLLGCLAAFDGSINACKRLAEKSGIQANLRRVLKG